MILTYNPPLARLANAPRVPAHYVRRRYRSGSTDDRIKHAILLTINGIAAGCVTAAELLVDYR
jgi:hypothetical protein